MKKRLLSAFMALALCLTLLPAPAWAAETEGTAQTPPAVEKAADPANGKAEQESQPAETKQENQPAEQEEQQEDPAVKQAVAAVQALIDALPDAAELDGMNDEDAMAVYEAFQTACDAYYDTLTEEQQAQLKNTEKLAALSEWFNAQVAPLENSGDIHPDTVDADGSIIRDEGWSRNGPIYEGGNGDADFTDAQFYVVQGNDVTIGGNLTIGGSCALILCQGAKLTVTGALIHKGGTFPIYGVSNSGENAGRLVIQNSSGSGAAIRSSEENAQLQINSGELEISGGNSQKLVDGVKLYSTNHIHQGTLDGTALSPAEWGVTSLKGGTLTLAYCTHDNDTYVSVNQTQHKKNCPDCGFVGTAVACGNNGSIGYVSDGANGHYQKCPCGNLFGDVIAHTIETASTNDGKKHTSMCGFCGYTPENGTEAEHSYDENGKCTVCQFQPILQGANGSLYDDLATALDEGEAALTLVSYATGDANKGIVKTNLEFDRNATITLDMGGCTLENSTGGATITVARGTLTVKGDATIEQTGGAESASSAVRVTGGRVIFEGNLTATGASGKPAVEVTGGTLRLKAGDVLNGGVSVAGSTTYANVNALLGENLAFAKKDDTSTIVKGDVKSISENVTVVAHTHSFTRDSEGKYTCICGYTCPHNDFKDGKCTVCGNRCAHTDVGDDGVCRNCQTQMAVKITASDNTVTYGTDFKAAMNAAVGGTKITLLADVSIQGRTGISGDNTTVTLDLNEHKITSGWLDVGGKDTNGIYTACTLKIIGKGSYEPPMYCGIITVDLKATLDLSEWEGGTISSINISDDSRYEAETREAAVIVGPNAGTIGKLTFGNNQLDELKKTKLSGGSFNEIWVAGFGPVKLGELLADGYAFQNEDGPYVKYETTLQGASISNVKVVTCPHGGKNGFDNNSTNCPYCNAPAVAETALNNGEGSSLLRRFANLQTAIDADRAGGAEFKLLTDVTGDYTIDGTQNTGLDLNGHSIKGTVTVKGIKGDYITTTLSNTENTTTASIDKVVACDGAELAGSKYPAVIGTLTLAEGATWKNILNLKTLGYKVLNADGTYKWYAPDDVKGSQLNNVIINSLPITSKTLYLKVNGKNLIGSSPKVERGTTVQLCASCNANDVTVTLSILKTGETTPITLTEPSYAGGKYTKDYSFDTIGEYTIYFTATKDGYTVTSTPKKLTVTKPNLSNAEITFPNGNEAAFNYATSTGVPTFVVKYNGTELEKDVDFVITSGDSTYDVGPCTLTIKAKDNGNYTGSKSAEWKVRPLKVEASVGDIIKTYDGTTALPDGTKITFKSADTYYTGATLRLAKGTDYEVLDAHYDSADASTEEKTVSFTIELKNEGYVFDDGKTQKDFTLNGAELDDKSFKINKAAAPTNIQSGTLNIINGTQQTYTYDFKELLPELSESEYGTISYGNQAAISLVPQSGYYYDETIVEFKKGKLTLAQFYAKDGEMTGQIGTVNVTVTTTNYENFQLTLVLNAVNQIKPTPDGEITAAEITYGDALSKSTISGKMKDPDTGKSVNGTFAWTDGTIKPNAGGYEAEWTFTPAAGYEKYATATGTVTIKVNKATPTFTAPTAQENLTYTGQEQALITAGSVTDYGTMQYSLTENGTYSQNIPAGTDAGTYTVWYRVIGDANHNDTAPASVVVRIGQKPLTITGVTAASKSYDGTTDAGITSVTFDGVTLIRGTDYTVTANFEDANVGSGKNVTATVTLMGQTAKNYVLEQSSFPTTGSIIKAAAPDFTKETTLTIVNDCEKTYTVTLPALPTLETPKEYGALTYEIGEIKLNDGYYTSGAKVENGELTLPIQKNDVETTGSVGTVTVVIKSANYEDITLTVNISAKNKLSPILAGTLTLTPIKITYGEPLSKIKITGTMKAGDTVVEGTFSWQQPGDTILDANTLGHNVGWKFTPTDGNTYTEVTGTATVKVDKAQQYGKVSMAGYTYGQTPSTPTLTDRTGDGSVTYYYTTTNSNSGGTKWENIQADTLNAGTYYMYAELGETENYGSFTAACVQFRVAKATPPYTKPTDLTAKYGQTLADVTLPDGWSWTDSSESVGGASTAAKTFQAKFTPTDTDNYNMVENIGLEVMVNKADGGNLKTVELEQKYTDTSDHTYTPDWAGLPAGQNWTFSSEASIVLPKQDFAADGSLLTYAISGGKAGDKITITLKASCNNYEDFTITLTITLTEKDNQQALRITGGTTVVYGQTLQLGTSGGTGSGAVTYTVTNGTGEATIDSNGVLTPVRIGSVTVTATKAGDSEYNAVTSSPVEITITRATPTGEPAYTKITASGKTLADAALTLDGGTISLADGKLEWIDDRGNVLPDETVVEANKTYRWRFTPANGSYTTLTGSIQLWHKSTSSGGGSYYAPTVPDMPMLYRGCTGDAVKTLQEKLNAEGFDSGNVDGIFGAKTYAAVTAFQKANGLGVDGIVGKLTWGKLYGVSPAMPVETTTVVGRPMVSYGSRGDAVRKLQEMLNTKGCDCGSVDGIFGSKTKAAVLAFQKANGLGADGIVGPLTWGKLV